MSDFVILFHRMPPGADRAAHWDLMLRQGDELLTWALHSEPGPGRIIYGKRLPNHRLHYLDHEGPISHNRGTVKRFARGQFRWIIGPSDDMWQAELTFGEAVWLVTVRHDNVHQDPSFSFEVSRD